MYRTFELKFEHNVPDGTYATTRGSKSAYYVPVPHNRIVPT